MCDAVKVLFLLLNGYEYIDCISSVSTPDLDESHTIAMGVLTNVWTSWYICTL